MRITLSPVLNIFLPNPCEGIPDSLYSGGNNYFNTILLINTYLSYYIKNVKRNTISLFRL